MPAGDVFRARLILALDDGLNYATIKQRLHTTARPISRCKQRFEKSGIDRLEPRYKRSKPRTATPSVQARCAAQCSRSLKTVLRTGQCANYRQKWGSASRAFSVFSRKPRLKPHRLERYMASNDPHFEEKAADIIGLYMDPPQHAPIFCVDEKTAI